MLGLCVRNRLEAENRNASKGVIICPRAIVGANSLAVMGPFSFALPGKCVLQEGQMELPCVEIANRRDSRSAGDDSHFSMVEPASSSLHEVPPSCGEQSATRNA